MALEMKLWQVEGDRLHELATSPLDYEHRIETWIATDPTILGIDLVVIGRQVNTGFGRIDLLAVTRDGDIAIIEVKRDRTPREVVAQLLDYASWVNELLFEDLDRICLAHRGDPLRDTYTKAFDAALAVEVSGVKHSFIIVSSEFDQSTERIVRYLAEKHNLAINAAFFRFFRQGRSELLGRAWLLDPEEVYERSETRRRPSWSGYWFVNVGEGEHRNWEDNRKYGYISAGQGERYSRALRNLSPGDQIFAYMKGHGYVGYGEVVAPAVPIREFVPPGMDRPLLELPLLAPRAAENADDPSRSEWAIPMRWINTVDRGAARRFQNMFANQNIVCKLRDVATVEILTREFGAERRGA